MVSRMAGKLGLRRCSWRSTGPEAMSQSLRHLLHTTREMRDRHPQPQAEDVAGRKLLPVAPVRSPSPLLQEALPSIAPDSVAGLWAFAHKTSTEGSPWATVPTQCRPSTR